MTEVVPQSPIQEKRPNTLGSVAKVEATNLWERVKNRLPFWKQEVKNEPKEVIEEISEISAAQSDSTIKKMEENKEPEELFVEGMPEGSRITTATYPDGERSMEAFRQMIKNGEWNFKIGDEGGWLWMQIKPKISEEIKDVGDGKYLDTKIASLDENGNLITGNGYKVFHEGENTIPSENNILFRGLSKEEMNNIISSGSIKSEGGEGYNVYVHKNLTYFSPDPDVSVGFSIGGVMMPNYRPVTFEHPNYMIAIKDPGGHIVENTTEVAIDTIVSKEQIDKIYEIRPVLIKEGKIPIIKSEDGRIIPGDILNNAHYAPKFEVALKDVTNDFLNKDQKDLINNPNQSETLTEQQSFKTEIWEYLDSEEEKSLDYALDLFENHINKMTDPEILGKMEDQSHVLSFMTGLMKKDKSIDSSVTVIQTTDYSPNDPRVVGLPEELKSEIVSIYKRHNRSREDEIEIQNDPRLVRLWNLMNSYHDKEIQLLEEKGIADSQIPIPGIDETNRQFVRAEYLKTYRQKIEEERKYDFEAYLLVNDRLYERRVEGKIVTPESFLGHGTPLPNFEKMLKNGGLKSPWYAQQTEEPEYGIRTIGIDPGAVFFFSDKMRDGTFGQYADLHRMSDIGIIFRIDTLLQKGYTIGSKTGTDSESEYFATASPETFSSNTLTPEQRHDLALKDTTELDIKDAYLRVTNSREYGTVITLLKSHGFEEDWIKEHVVFHDRLAPRRELMEWLQTRKLSPLSENQKSVTYSPVKGWEDNYFIWQPRPK